MDTLDGPWHSILQRGVTRSTGLTIFRDARMLLRWAHGAPRLLHRWEGGWMPREICSVFVSNSYAPTFEDIEMRYTFYENRSQMRSFIWVNSHRPPIA